MNNFKFRETKAEFLCYRFSLISIDVNQEVEHSFVMMKNQFSLIVIVFESSIQRRNISKEPSIIRAYKLDDHQELLSNQSNASLSSSITGSVSFDVLQMDYPARCD